MSAYAAIDLKSFYASVECVDRGLDPLTTNLVVADEERSDKTICLAVSPSLKSLGLPGRCRLFEVRQKAAEYQAKHGQPLRYLVAKPRMKKYMDISSRIYAEVYLHFFAPEDVYIYSIDEVFVDLTRYLSSARLTPRELVSDVIHTILSRFGITATGGIGDNLYLAKVAMDILAKHEAADEHGVRIAELNERSYRERLWSHRPLESFWRVGHGIADRLRRMGCETMGDVAMLSLRDEDRLFHEFGVDAELLIDHAWGVESCRMEDIHAFHPSLKSISCGQVLAGPESQEVGRIIVGEMADELSLQLVEQHFLCSGIGLSIGFEGSGSAHKSSHVSLTASGNRLVAVTEEIYDAITTPASKVRRFYLAMSVVQEDEAQAAPQQLSMFDAPDADTISPSDLKERQLQETILSLRSRFGSNTVLRGTSFLDGATMRERHGHIGGHSAGEEETDLGPQPAPLHGS
ncbi:MAG: DNA methylase [Clostridia bacterium]|nr:DNA methylase [Clostridia bacterium]